VTARSQPDLDEEFQRLEPLLPRWAAKFVKWVRQPGSRWVRLPLALLLIAAGFVGFLPILGFWMVPLGLVLIAQDVPFLKPPLARALRWAHDKWDAHKRNRSRSK
jgi:hypothetical protein